MPRGEFRGQKLELQLIKNDGGPLAFRAPASSDRIRVAFEPTATLPMMECIACEEMVLWDAKKKRWVCPECTYEVLPDEALVIVKQHEARLRLLKSDIGLKRGSGLRWLLARWFGKRRQLSP